jgi:shikimate dehydrogenase
LTEISGATRLVGLLGAPDAVARSLSPRMQNAAFASRGLDWAYVPLPVGDHAALLDAVRGLAALGFAGANVTVPYKGAAYGLCDETDKVAGRSGAVNTLVFTPAGILGLNTDGPAVVEAVAAAGADALVLGGGGAAAGVVAALELAGAQSVRRASRRDSDWPPDADAATILVNATPVRDELIVQPRAAQAVVDLPYRQDGRATALVEAARAAGSDPVVDGLEVLVRQGALSFERWTGVPAPVDVMRAAVRFAG